VGGPDVAHRSTPAWQAFDGKVAYVGAVLDPETRTVKVRVSIDNRAGTCARHVRAPVFPAPAAAPSSCRRRPCCKAGCRRA
jgi:hypothetical protein